MLGALIYAITDPSRTPFQPMNANMGLLPPLENKEHGKKKSERHLALALRSRTYLTGLQEKRVLL
jgi:folate-dependent tRNA-U54 methylase TrmFO/GidA